MKHDENHRSRALIYREAPSSMVFTKQCSVHFAWQQSRLSARFSTTTFPPLPLYCICIVLVCLSLPQFVASYLPAACVCMVPVWCYSLRLLGFVSTHLSQR